MGGSGRGEGKGKRADVAACRVWLWLSPNISMLMISRGKEASLWVDRVGGRRRHRAAQLKCHTREREDAIKEAKCDEKREE
jgi:hypothetical protein